jgi:hypothetical protein
MWETTQEANRPFSTHSIPSRFSRFEPRALKQFSTHSRRNWKLQFNAREMRIKWLTVRLTQRSMRPLVSSYSLILIQRLWFHDFFIPELFLFHILKLFSRILILFIGCPSLVRDTLSGNKWVVVLVDDLNLNFVSEFFLYICNCENERLSKPLYLESLRSWEPLVESRNINSLTPPGCRWSMTIKRCPQRLNSGGENVTSEELEGTFWRNHYSRFLSSWGFVWHFYA